MSKPVANSGGNTFVPNGHSLRGDHPIECLADDRLGRRRFAEALAEDILSLPLKSGYVIGLTGPWGSGKTSILNMTVEAIGNRAHVVQFNPWLFSGTEALLTTYFTEIAKQFGHKADLKPIARRLATYGRLLLPIAAVLGAGSVAGAAVGLLNNLSSQPSVSEQRAELRRCLAKLGRPVVTIIDDVDRLQPQEVLDIMRLVRLVGDFPNTLYLLAFDQHRVEECLGGGDVARGRVYLEKIVQVTHDLPLARTADNVSLFLDGLRELLDHADTSGPLYDDDWQNVFAFIIRPLLQTPRQVRRYLESLPVILRRIGDEVALADVLALEAIRILRPEMFAAIIDNAEALGVSAAARTENDAEHSPVGPLVSVDRALAVAVCRWLFPAAQRYFDNVCYGLEWEPRWRRRRKVASHEVLRFYLEGKLPTGVVPARTLERALTALTDAEAFRTLLEGLSTDELMDILERLAVAVREIPFDANQPSDQDPARIALPVLLQMLPRLWVDIDAFRGTVAVMRVVHPLLKRITTTSQVLDLLRKIMNELGFSQRLALLNLIGHREHVGTQLIDAKDARYMEDQLRSDLSTLSAERLGAEADPVGLATLLAESAEGREAILRSAMDDRFMLSLLTHSVTTAQAYALGAAAVTATELLNWEGLISLLGSEVLMVRISELQKQLLGGQIQVSSDERRAIELAVQYVDGRRPHTAIGGTSVPSRVTPGHANMEALPTSPDPTDPDHDEPHPRL